MIGLTPQQLACFQYLSQYFKDNGCSPTYREIGAALELTSTSNVQRLLDGLEDRQYIRRLHSKKRAIEILHPRQVTIKDEIFGPIAEYAKEEGKSVETIVNALLRNAMGLAA